MNPTADGGVPGLSGAIKEAFGIKKIAELVELVPSLAEPVVVLEPNTPDAAPVLV